MAETTTATWLPRSTSRLTCAATLRMRSRSATEVPPNFMTIRAMASCGVAGLDRLRGIGRSARCRYTGGAHTYWLWRRQASAAADGAYAWPRHTRASHDRSGRGRSDSPALAAEWWDPNGKFAPLHKFNPVRLAFIRDQAAALRARPARPRPFAGLRLLDIGCGGGLLCEPMARLGFAVTGVDAVGAEHRDRRALHAEQRGLAIDYRAHAGRGAGRRRGERFDVILNMEVIEHVADLAPSSTRCARC